MRARKILLVIILTVIAIVRVNAQVNEGGFRNAVDYLICKTVEYSLKDTPIILSEYQQTCPCIKNPSSAAVNSFLINKHGFDKTIALVKEIESLKSSYNKSWKPEDAAKFLSETIFADKTKYQKLYSFADKRRTRSDYISFKSDLNKELIPVLSATTNEINSGIHETDSSERIVPSAMEQRVLALEEGQRRVTVEEKNWLSGISNYLIILSLVLSSIALFISLINSREKSSEIPDLNGLYNSLVPRILDSKRVGELIQSEFNRRLNQRDIVDAVLNKLRPEIIKLIEEKSESKTVIWDSPQDLLPKQEISQSEAKQPEVRGEIFYLSNPNSDGSFNESSASTTYKEAASIYRFTKIEKGRAKFQIDERESSIKLALQFPAKSIDPVCDAQNAFNPKAKSILTKTPGEVELNGGKWIVNSKAKITYEG